MTSLTLSKQHGLERKTYYCKTKGKVMLKWPWPIFKHYSAVALKDYGQTQETLVQYQPGGNFSRANTQY
jgi:hypothetical protein